MGLVDNGKERNMIVENGPGWMVYSYIRIEDKYIRKETLEKLPTRVFLFVVVPLLIIAAIIEASLIFFG